MFLVRMCLWIRHRQLLHFTVSFLFRHWHLLVSALPSLLFRHRQSSIAHVNHVVIVSPQALRSFRQVHLLRAAPRGGLLELENLPDGWRA